jgi:hypothetical protein
MKPEGIIALVLLALAIGFPRNCLPEHRPLGNINRMRLAVYLASLQVRRKLNMVGA